MSTWAELGKRKSVRARVEVRKISLLAGAEAKPEKAPVGQEARSNQNGLVAACPSCNLG